MSKLLSSLLLALAASTPAAELTPRFETCVSRSNGVTMFVLECIGAETVYQDHRLNVAYDKLLLRMNSYVRKEKLRLGQRAWIKYRDESCQLYYTNIEDGSMARIEASNCIMVKTAERAEELEKIME